MFIVKLVTKLMGYSTLVFSQIKPIDPSKNIGEMIFNTVKNNIINDSGIDIEKFDININNDAFTFQGFIGLDKNYNIIS